MKDTNYIKVTGDIVNHSMFGTTRDNQENIIVAIVSDYTFPKVKVGEEIRLGICPKLVNGNFVVHNLNVLVSEVWKVTDVEIQYLHQAITHNNMRWGEYTIKKEFFNWNEGKMNHKEETLVGLLWNDKDEFPIVIDGKRITYKELDGFEFTNDKFVLSWDNGYSYCAAKSEDVSHIKTFIDNNLFSDDAKKGHNGRVFTNTELYGYNFGKDGALMIRTTDKKFFHSEVSDS